jgi:hypothetical protein
VTWRPLGSISAAIGSTAYIGLPLTSHVAAVGSTAVFDKLSVAP